MAVIVLRVFAVVLEKEMKLPSNPIDVEEEAIRIMMQVLECLVCYLMCDSTD